MERKNILAQLQRIAISSSQLENNQISLTAEQHHYLSRVLRLKEGDRFIAMNGRGEWWLAKLTSEIAEILEPISIQTELPVAITLIVALPKGNGFDEVVRQATALGVASIIPTISDRTLLNPSPQKLERWRRIATEAAEQSERQIVPTILDPVPFNTALSFCQTIKSTETSPIANHQYICVPRDNHPHLLTCWQEKPLIRNHPEQMTIAIATGPEGGWTDAEVEQAYAASFQPVSLGRRILTAVLAPIVALSVLAAGIEMGTMDE